MVEMNDLSDSLKMLWESISTRMKSGNYSGNRIYQRLDLGEEAGIRISMLAPDGFKEFIIELHEEELDIDIPKWRGLHIDQITLNVPSQNTKHVRLLLQNPQYDEIFTYVCLDIIKALKKVQDSSERMVILDECFGRWASFFAKHSPEGLTKEAQRGLFGELYLLEELLEAGMDKIKAVESWRRVNPRYHDFHFEKRSIEVKTTIGKEPRKVRINNERQLDNQGLQSLYLYILTLHPVESGVRTLPELISAIRWLLEGNSKALMTFESFLKDVGYLDVQSDIYSTGYIIRNKEVFNVKEGFPRITSLCPGLGDIQYSILISSCKKFKVDAENTLDEFIGGK